MSVEPGEELVEDSTAREQRDAARANRTYRTLERIVAAQRKAAASSDEPIDTSDAQATPHDSAADTRT